MARSREPAFEPDEAARRFRGSVARRGARVVVEGPGQRPMAGPDRERGGPAADWEPEVWERDADETPAPAARPRPRSRPPTMPVEVRGELRGAVEPARVERAEERLAEAVRAYQRDRYPDALKALVPVARAAPTSGTVRELHGLILYRLGRWTAAIKELEAFHALTGSFDQHPVLADSQRALKRWAAVEATFEQLRQASPAADVLTEGRIVLAGARADQGDLVGAIEVLARARTRVRRPQLQHLRLWYALADLYERAGEVPRARLLFRDVVEHDPDFVDAARRLAALD